jgi:hypothetical protein
LCRFRCWQVVFVVGMPSCCVVAGCCSCFAGAVAGVILFISTGGGCWCCQAGQANSAVFHSSAGGPAGQLVVVYRSTTMKARQRGHWQNGAHPLWLCRCRRSQMEKVATLIENVRAVANENLRRLVEVRGNGKGNIAKLPVCKQNCLLARERERCQFRTFKSSCSHNTT